MTVAPGPLKLEPGSNFTLIEAPILSQAKTRKAIQAALARALVDPRHGDLQQCGDVVDFEQRCALRGRRQRHDGLC